MRVGAPSACRSATHHGNIKARRLTCPGRPQSHLAAHLPATHSHRPQEPARVRGGGGRAVERGAGAAAAEQGGAGGQVRALEASGTGRGRSGGRARRPGCRSGNWWAGEQGRGAAGAAAGSCRGPQVGVPESAGVREGASTAAARGEHIIWDALRAGRAGGLGASPDAEGRERRARGEKRGRASHPANERRWPGGGQGRAVPQDQRALAAPWGAQGRAAKRAGLAHTHPAAPKSGHAPLLPKLATPLSCRQAQGGRRGGQAPCTHHPARRRARGCATSPQQPQRGGLTWSASSDPSARMKRLHSSGRRPCRDRHERQHESGHPPAKPAGVGRAGATTT